eukprot:g25107.t1
MHNLRVLQTIVSTFKEAYESMGLTLNIRKAKGLQQPGLALCKQTPNRQDPPGGLKHVDCFQHLMSVLLTKAAIDEEIQHRL